MPEQFVVVLAEQGTVYGPFDHPTALLFMNYLSAEVDPADVRKLCSPVLDLLGWRESIGLEIKKAIADTPADATEKLRPEPSGAQDEVDAIGAAYEALKPPLDFGAQLRALRWLGDRLDSDHRATQTDHDEECPF
jgi:hypothetical protein